MVGTPVYVSSVRAWATRGNWAFIAYIERDIRTTPTVSVRRAAIALCCDGCHYAYSVMFQPGIVPRDLELGTTRRSAIAIRLSSFLDCFLHRCTGEKHHEGVAELKISFRIEIREPHIIGAETLRNRRRINEVLSEIICIICRRFPAVGPTERIISIT